MSFEQPTVHLLGKAQDLVRGIYGAGFDLDASQVPEGAEFELDECLAGVSGTLEYNL